MLPRAPWGNRSQHVSEWEPGQGKPERLQPQPRILLETGRGCLARHSSAGRQDRSTSQPCSPQQAGTGPAKTCCPPKPGAGRAGDGGREPARVPVQRAVPRPLCGQSSVLLRTSRPEGAVSVPMCTSPCHRAAAPTVCPRAHVPGALLSSLLQAHTKLLLPFAETACAV